VLQRTIRATIEKYGMFDRGDKVVVALSGGPDSVALLHALNSLGSIYRLQLHAAHLEHGIRGEESLADMQFVESLCKDLAVPLSVEQVNVPELADSSRLSMEAVARKARYAFLNDVLKDTGAGKIATGHNANDQAETVMLNIIRGAGMAGLRGIRPAIENHIVRPLIEATREQIIAYLNEKQLKYVVDSSNLDEKHERNKVRHTLLPLVEKEFNPRIVESLARTAGVFSMVNEYIESKVADAKSSCCRSEDGRFSIDLEALQGFPKAIKLFTLYSILRSLEGDEQVVSFDSLNAMLNLAIRSKSGSRIDIGSGIVALKEYDRLVVGRDLALAETYEVRLEVPGTTRVEQAGCEFEVEILNERPGTGEVYRSGDSAYFDFSEIELPLAARNWREGDKFVPFGLSGTKKVHDVFIDEKVRISERSKVPIVTDRDGIIWVAGVRRAERARITGETGTIMKITYRKEE
jgi:tRNA(Ile)-lysidine synthase